MIESMFVQIFTQKLDLYMFHCTRIEAWKRERGMDNFIHEHPLILNEDYIARWTDVCNAAAKK